MALKSYIMKARIHTVYSLPTHFTITTKFYYLTILDSLDIRLIELLGVAGSNSIHGIDHLTVYFL